MTHLVYLASPIDKSVKNRGSDFEHHRILAILMGQGFTVFDPAGAWRNGINAPERVREADERALDSADAVYVNWRDGGFSVGVPMEIERATSQGKPVAIVGPIQSAMLARPNICVFEPGKEATAAEWLRDQLTVNPTVTVGVEADTSKFQDAMFRAEWILNSASITLAGLQRRVREFQEAKGWLHDGRTFGDDIALMHSELSEALEVHRDGHDPALSWIGEDGHDDKPGGIPSEFADLLIRLVGACNEWGVDLEAALAIKLDYNDTREHRHGGKLL